MWRWLCVLLVVFNVSFSYAEVYQIPEELQKEVEVRKAALEANPTSNEALFELAMSYAYTGQILLGWNTLRKLPEAHAKEVIKIYEPIVEAEPENWRAPFKLGFGLFFRKKKQEAIDMFYVSHERNPDSPWALGFVALVMGEMGRVDEGIAVCKRALKIEPNATAIHFLLGEGYRKKDDYMKFLQQMMIVGRLQTEEALERGEDK